MWRFCRKNYRKHTLSILFKDDGIFSTHPTDFIPKTHFFRDVWSCEGVSDSIRESIWNHLCVILFTVLEVDEADDKEKVDAADFGAAATQMFSAISESDLMTKLTETLDRINATAMAATTDATEAAATDATDTEAKEKDSPFSVEKIRAHLSSVMKGNIGKLACEIAEEAVADLGLSDCTDNKEVFLQLLKDKSKLQQIYTKVTTRVQEKIESGELKESEVIEETKELLNEFRNMPHMGELGKLFSSIGGFNPKKMDVGAMEAAMADRKSTRLNSSH